MYFWLVSYSKRKKNDSICVFIVAVDNLADAENSTAAEEEEQKKREEAKLSVDNQLNGDVKPTDQYVFY
jgi:hypothetical protein